MITDVSFTIKAHPLIPTISSNIVIAQRIPSILFASDVKRLVHMIWCCYRLSVSPLKCKKVSNASEICCESSLRRPSSNIVLGLNSIFPITVFPILCMPVCLAHNSRLEISEFRQQVRDSKQECRITTHLLQALLPHK